MGGGVVWGGQYADGTMTVQVIPTFNSPFWTQTTTLEGVLYLLSFSYCQREECWYLSVADANGSDIYNGMKLTVGSMLLAKCKDPRKPAGELIVMSGSTDLSPPGLNDLVPGAGRCALYYITSDVMAMILNGTIGTYIKALATNTTQGQASTYGQR